MFRISSFILALLVLLVAQPVASADLTAKAHKDVNTSSVKPLSFDHGIRLIAQDQQWLDLLHHKKSHLSAPSNKQSPNSFFYISGQESIQPEEELRALVDALQSADLKVLCRFPARVHWLKAKLAELEFLEDQFSEGECDEFDAWFESVGASAISLVYPVAYLNSPSSMYGHTFIRFDRRDDESGKQRSELLDMSVSYAANSQADDNPLSFLIKGLAGGYPGVFSVLPYYEKVKEYSFLEARDVWSYKLDLNQEEVDQFVRHLWEIKDIQFDYYFFDENCSYQVLNLLDASSERFQFAKQFRHSAIPADTVKAIVNAGLVREASFRPSTVSQLQTMINASTESHQSLAMEVLENPNNIASLIGHLSPTDQAEILDLSYQFSRYLAVQKKADMPNLSKRSLALLSARSKLTVELSGKNSGVLDKQMNTEFLREEQGHDSTRILTSFGYDGENHYVQLGLRAAYHDHLDSLTGYVRGAQLQMFDLALRRVDYGSGNSTDIESDRSSDYAFQIQSFTLVDIATYTPRNRFIDPISWNVSVGWRRPQTAPRELSPFLNVGGGYSFDYLGQNLYLIGDVEAFFDNDIEKGYRIGSGPKIGWLSQHQSWSSKLEMFAPLDIFGARYQHRQLSWEISTSLSFSWQFRVKLVADNFREREAAHTQQLRGFSLGLARYF